VLQKCVFLFIFNQKWAFFHILTCLSIGMSLLEEGAPMTGSSVLSHARKQCFSLVFRTPRQCLAAVASSPWCRRRSSSIAAGPGVAPFSSHTVVTAGLRLCPYQTRGACTKEGFSRPKHPQISAQKHAPKTTFRHARNLQFHPVI
jgi:hypothetical protein